MPHHRLVHMNNPGLGPDDTSSSRFLEVYAVGTAGTEIVIKVLLKSTGRLYGGLHTVT